jgi:hypothetical protein
MRNLTLDLDALAVDSFSTDVAGDPSQWTAAMYAPSDLATCQTNDVADSFVCAGVAALTDVYPCKTTR